MRSSRAAACQLASTLLACVPSASTFAKPRSPCAQGDERCMGLRACRMALSAWALNAIWLAFACWPLGQILGESNCSKHRQVSAKPASGPLPGCLLLAADRQRNRTHNCCGNRRSRVYLASPSAARLRIPTQAPRLLRAASYETAVRQEVELSAHPNETTALRSHIVADRVGVNEPGPSHLLRQHATIFDFCRLV